MELSSVSINDYYTFPAYQENRKYIFQLLPGGGLVSNVMPMDLLQADGACERLQINPKMTAMMKICKTFTPLHI